jgi:transposase
MRVMYERCCGLDIHKKSIVACRVIPGPEGEWRREACTFGTTNRDLLQLADWLKEEKATHVAMESTEIYWKPVYNLLEGQFEVLVVNAQRLRVVPGRKTDAKDAEWIAELLQHVLLQLTRHRASLVRECARVVQRYRSSK